MHSGALVSENVFSLFTHNLFHLFRIDVISETSRVKQMKVHDNTGAPDTKRSIFFTSLYSDINDSCSKHQAAYYAPDSRLSRTSCLFIWTGYILSLRGR